MIATGGFLTALECTKFVFGRGSAPDPAGGAYSAPPDPLAGLRGPTSKGKEMGREGEEGRKVETPFSINSRLRPCIGRQNVSSTESVCLLVA